LKNPGLPDHTPADRSPGGRTVQPLSPLIVKDVAAPNVELLRRIGWSVASITGSYCVAWRGRDEVVFEWRGDGWYRVGGRGAAEES
jgi:hypothetical protein